MEFPNLSAAKRIALDLETFDPYLKEEGPGEIRGDGFIVGIALGTDEGRWYFPIRHEGGGNMDEQRVLEFVRDALADPRQEKVGANLSYDLSWLKTYGIDVAGRWLDVQNAEPLLDETAFSYSLDNLARKYLGETKVEDELTRYVQERWGAKAKVKENIWRCPAHVVAPYAKGDVDLPLRILPQQLKQLEAEELLEVWDLECRIMPMLLAMRRRGVRIDLEAAAQLADRFQEMKKQYLKVVGGINVNAPTEVAPLLDRLGIPYPMTQKTKKASITKDFLKTLNHPVGEAIRMLRKMDKFSGTFINSYLDKAVNGRIHCRFHQLRNDEHGTVSGRFSSSDPNLQQVPKRGETKEEKALAKLIRGLFLPEPGEFWSSQDWSQIEYRLLAHYGIGPTAELAREKYRTDPTTDFHVYASEVTGVERDHAKNINFGLVYGMGVEKLARSLGLTLDEAKDIFAHYHTELPFVKETYNAVSKTASNRGYIRTLKGRRRRFEFWEAQDFSLKGKVPILRNREQLQAIVMGLREAALEAGEKPPLRGIKRAHTHKALNALLQGGAADVMKTAMVKIWESGICDVLGAPLLTVHDELDWSVPNTKEGREALAESKHIMENCVDLKIPLRVEQEDGETWGTTEKVA